MISVTLSSTVRSASRRSWVARTAAASRSYARTPTYSASAPRSTRTTVASLAGAPSAGSRWRKPSSESAAAQSASSSRPSSRIGPAAVRAVAGPGPGRAASEESGAVRISVSRWAAAGPARSDSTTAAAARRDDSGSIMRREGGDAGSSAEQGEEDQPEPGGDQHDHRFGDFRLPQHENRRESD